MLTLKMKHKLKNADQKVKATMSDGTDSIKHRSLSKSLFKAFKIPSIPRMTRAIKRKISKHSSFTGYFSLYRYATGRDIALLFVSLIATLLSGACIPALSIFFGRLANTMIMLHVIQNRDTGPNATFCTDIVDNTEFNWKNPTKQMEEELYSFFMMFTSFAAAYIALNIISFVCWSIPAEKQTVCWATEYVNGLLGKDMEWFDHCFGFEATSDVVENICLVRQGIGIQVPLAINLLSTFILSSACVLWRAYWFWNFVVICVVVIPFNAYLQQLIDSTTASQSATFTQSVTPVIAFAEQVFRRIKSVILHNGQKKELHYFKLKQSQSLRMSKCSILSLSFLNSFMAFGATVYFAMVLWQGTQLVWEDRTCREIHGFKKFDAEVLFTVFGCVMCGMLNIWLLQSIYETFVKARVSGAKLAQIIDSESPDVNDDTNGIVLEKIEGKIEFEDVGFAYASNKNVQVLKGTSFCIQPGWKVGFAGVLGTGLSTLFKLLLLNYIPDYGFIRLDDIDIRLLDRNWYLSNLGYLTHDPLIFNDTIEANIRKGNSIATQDEIEEACKAAEVHELILQLRNGYQTIAGDNGEVLSPQLRVQIALARVMLQKPKILILDEPTLTLDWQSSCTIERILDKVRQNITTLLIPNRFHSLTNADMIFVVSNGEIVEKGSHDELMEKKGALYQMINQTDITPSKRLELAKLNKVFLGKQLLPPFSIPKFWTNIPTTMGVTTTQLWLESKLATPTFGEHSFDEETGRVKRHTRVTQPALGNKPNPVINKVGSDTSWKKCIIKEDKHFANPSSAYTPVSEDDTFCCWTILRLTFQSQYSLPCIVIGMMASCALGLMVPIYGYILGKTVEILGKSDMDDSVKETKKYCIRLVILGSASFAVIFIKNFAFELGSHICFKRVQKHLFTCILRQEFSWFEQPENNNHALQTRLSKDVLGVQYIAKTFYDSVSHYTATVFACIGWAIYVSPRLGAICLFVVLASMASTCIDAILLTSIEERRKKKIKLLRGLIAELCNKRQSLRALQLQPYFLDKFKSTIESTYTSSEKDNVGAHVLFDICTLFRRYMLLICLRGLTFGLSQGGAYLVYALYVRIGGIHMISHDVSFTTVVKIGHLLIVEMIKVGVAISMIATLNNAMVCGANILMITKRLPKICLDKGHAKEIIGDIKFRNVQFWFECLPSVLLLKEVSFRVKPGQSVALVGVAGSGKSICLQLILRLRDAPLGTVEIDGEDIRNFNCVQLRQQVAYLHNEPLIDDNRTVREVIAYGDNTRQVEIDEIIEAAQKANIHTFISSLPQGYDTMVGTTRLTVGQKRRIFYARLFIKNPRILLIEESCTALDPESERKVVSSFERLRQGRTCLILAHRVRTAETADCILVFHRGRIQERGTHKQLMESGGMYKQIHEAQSGKNQLYESTLVRKFDNQDTPYHYGDFDTISVDNLKRKRSSSLPNLSAATANHAPSTGSLNIRQAISFEDFADNIVNNISHGFIGLFSPLARSKRSTNK